MQFIIIDINSDLDPITYPIDTDSEEQAARDALRDAGLAFAPIWHGEPGDPDAYKDSAQKLFASAAHDETD